MSVSLVAFLWGFASALLAVGGILDGERPRLVFVVALLGPPLFVATAVKVLCECAIRRAEAR